MSKPGKAGTRLERIRMKPALHVLDDQVHRNWAWKHLIVRPSRLLLRLSLLPYIHPRLAGYCSSQSAFHSFTSLLCFSKTEDSSEALATWGCSATSTKSSSRINGIYLPILSFHSSLRFSDQKPKHLSDYSNGTGGHLFHFSGFHRSGSWKVSRKVYLSKFLVDLSTDEICSLQQKDCLSSHLRFLSSSLRSSPLCGRISIYSTHLIWP